jgi:hypothetical protein
MSIPRLTAFRLSAGHYRRPDEEQDSQNDSRHDDCYVERTADGMLWWESATDFIPLGEVLN